MAANAFAWNCTDPLAARIDVGTTKPSGTPGDGDGQYFLGTGSEGTKGHYYVCEVPKKTPKGKTGGSSATSSSTSSASSGSTATGGNATATGGNATGGSVNGSGNSSSNSGVKNSGNSSNYNKNTAQGGAGGAGGSANQQQSNSSTNNNASSASASNNGDGNGNNSNNYASTTNNQAATIPVGTAFAPTTIPTVTCFKGFSGGVQTVPAGISFGGGKIDANCAIIEAAKHAPNRLAFCKVYIRNKYVKEAGVTLEDCMHDDPQPVVASSAVIQSSGPAAAVVAPAVVVNPNPPSAEPVFVPVQAQRVPSPVFSCDKADNVCKARLDDVTMYLQHNPNSDVILTSTNTVTSAAVASQIRAFLRKNGISANRIKLATGEPKFGRVYITFDTL